MSTKLESRQCTPSVIARLMGLEELTPQQSVPKQQRVLSENYLRRVASIGVPAKCSSREWQSFRLSVKDQEQIEKVYALQEKLKWDKHNKVSVEKRKAKPSLPEQNITFKNQKVTDVDSMSVDMEVQTLKKAHNVSAQDLRKDLFQSYLQKPSSLISTHLRDLQGIPLHVQSRYMPLNSLASSQCRKSDICLKNGLKIGPGNPKMQQTPEHCPIEGSQEEHSPDIIYKLPRYRKKSKNGASNPHSRIIVLKPNAERSESVSTGSSSLHNYPDSCLGDWKHKELYAETQNPDSYSRKKVDSLSSETTEHFPRSTGHGMSNNFRNTSGEGNTSGETPREESKSMIGSSLSLSNMKNGYHAAFCHVDGLRVDKEAKKNISERWRMITQGCQEVGIGTRSKLKTRTLGEMLTKPDNDTRPRNSHFKDGQKDVCSRNLITSRKPSTYSTGIMSLKTGINWRTVKTPESVIQAELRKRRFRRSQYIPQLESENDQSVRGNHVIETEPKNKFERNHPSHMATHMVAVAESEVVDKYFGNYKEQQLASMDFISLVEDDAYSSHFPEASNQQDILSRISDEGSVSSNFSSTDSESLLKLEDAYQPSPVSVLVPPFEDEISVGSESFHDVNLHGVEWQLEILKSESSGTFSEGSGMIMSSDDEDTRETSMCDSECKEDKVVTRLSEVEENKDFSYIVEVLTEAGFNGGNQGFGMWYSLECPINPRVFESLEKKYGKQTSWKRSERRLLFDWVNLGLIELLRPCMGVSTLTKSVFRRLRQGLDVVDELGMLLASSEKQAKTSTSTNAILPRSDDWLELGDEIEIIGREIENLLIDELTTEVVSFESF